MVNVTFQSDSIGARAGLNLKLVHPKSVGLAGTIAVAKSTNEMPSEKTAAKAFLPASFSVMASRGVSISKFLQFGQRGDATAIYDY